MLTDAHLEFSNSYSQLRLLDSFLFVPLKFFWFQGYVEWTGKVSKFLYAEII